MADERGLVALYAKHRSEIDELHSMVSGHEMFDSAVHDDLFLLRYVLSNEGNLNKVRVKLVFIYPADRCGAGSGRLGKGG